MHLECQTCIEDSYISHKRLATGLLAGKQLLTVKRELLLVQVSAAAPGHELYYIDRVQWPSTVRRIGHSQPIYHVHN